MMITDLEISNDSEFFLIAGPCVIESSEHAHMIARRLKEITERHDVNFVFKSSFDKANRSSIESYRGPGLKRGLEILESIRGELDLLVLTDIHAPEQAEPAASVVDIIQIPAFLSRQTDLLTAAGRTGKPVHIKKGQFMSPEGMGNVIEKIASTGNDKTILCERGAMFGYNNLVVDIRNLEIMKRSERPVVFDATHSVQRPGSRGDTTGGDREFAPTLARAALSAGIAGIFAEVHDDPPSAKSDAATQLYLDSFERHLKSFKEIDQVTKSHVGD